MSSGPEQHDPIESAIQSTQETLDKGFKFLFGEEALSKLQVYRSQGNEALKASHVEQFLGDPDSLEYALDIGDKDPGLMNDQLEAMTTNDIEALSPEEVAQVRRQLEFASRIANSVDASDLAFMKRQWSDASFQLQSHDFAEGTQEKFADKKHYSYEQLVQLAGVSDAGKEELFQNMDEGSQLRFAITYPVLPFIEGSRLESTLSFFNREVKDTGMAKLHEQAYGWSFGENPLNNPNLTAAQLEQIVDVLYKLPCQPRNANAFANADRVFSIIQNHPNASSNAVENAQRYRTWLRDVRNKKAS